MRKFKWLVPAAVSIVLFTLVSVAWAAYQHAGDADKDAKYFRDVYPAKIGTKLDNCNLCHSGGVNTSGKKPVTMGSCQWCHFKYGYDKSGDISATLNVYGKAYLDAGRTAAALTAIEGLDSDGDGFSNINEINATRYPGDAADDPTKVVASYRIYTKAQLQAMEQHSQFMLMNTTKSGDYYAEYSGVPMEALLKKAKVASNATKITVYAPDGYAQGHPIEDSTDNAGTSYAPYVQGTYPQALYYYNTEADKAITSYGWCDYASSGNAGRIHGEPIVVQNDLRMLLALQADGKDLIPGVLDETNKLKSGTEGPFRVVTPQKVAGPPDQASTATNQSVIWPYDANADHNAGFSSKSATIIKAEPLPDGTTDIDVLEAGWGYIDQEKIVIYGALEPLTLVYPENGATNVHWKKLALVWMSEQDPDPAATVTYTVEYTKDDPALGRWTLAQTKDADAPLYAGIGIVAFLGTVGMMFFGNFRKGGKLVCIVMMFVIVGTTLSACRKDMESRTVTLEPNTKYYWRVTADGPGMHIISGIASFTTKP